MSARGPFVVRVTLAPWQVQRHGEVFEALAEAGLAVVVHRDADLLCIELLAPAGVSDAYEWARHAAGRFELAGLNAQAATPWAGMVRCRRCGAMLCQRSVAKDACVLCGAVAPMDGRRSA